MCTKAEFAKLRDRIADVEKMNIAQSEQIKTLFAATKDLKDTVRGAFSKLLWFSGIVLLIVVLALVWGALGERGFNGVTKAAPVLAAKTISGECQEARGGDN